MGFKKFFFIESRLPGSLDSDENDAFPIAEIDFFQFSSPFSITVSSFLLDANLTLIFPFILIAV
jgi:hypothetical protein